MATAKDIMTDEVATIKGSATVAEAVQLMKFKKLHSLIVERRGPEDAYGIVTDTDIVNKVVAYGTDPKTVKVYEIMNKPCLVINPDLGVEYVARLFAHFGIDRAPVIQNDLIGIISNTDILQKSDFVENPRVPLLQKALQAQVAHARGVSAAKGPYSNAGKEAWAAVAELEAELAFCQGKAPDQTAVEEVPEAAPALV
ncbi:MAG TPA: CBS domain-containing protein [Leptolyngbyaceae cyanobacterium M65_K2018_010]|nr:CBS domain-containing protein [Leptolyngbyaceae cyanobacterium M65_K2018_010]